MGLWQRIFGTKEEQAVETQVPVPKVAQQQDMYTSLGLVKPVTDAERELVAVLAASILSGDQPDSTFVLKSVQAIDEERMHIAVIAASLAAMEYPDSVMRITKITPIEQ